MTGGFGEGETISDSQAAMNYANEKGIPKSKILIEEKSNLYLNKSCLNKGSI
mgnify:CR=1 FL=1